MKPGLYDSSGKLIRTWKELENEEMDVARNYDDDPSYEIENGITLPHDVLSIN